ncbi:MAG: MFS transporter [bacterium]
MSEVPAATAPKKPLRTSLWVSSTYFAEGLPYVIVLNIATVFFTDMGVREALLGFLNFFGIPWNLKFIWAPLLDLFGTKRGWMLKIQMAITVILFVIACLAGIHGTAGSSIILKAIAFSFVALAFIAATNDISIDAYYLEGLTDKREQAAYTGLRITAYRIAVIYARTVLVAVAGIANWFWGFTAGAVTMLAVLILHAFLLPKFEAERTGPSKTIADVGRGFVDSFVAYLTQAKPLTIILILLFVATYKMGDGIIFSMYTPFFKRELGVTNLQYSWLSGFVAALATIAGSLLGACWIKKLGLKRAIWPITLFMNLNIWAYVLLAAVHPSAAETSGITLIAVIHGYENIAAGLGNAALMVYLMRLCSVKFKAAHFAIGTAIMSLGSTLIGGFGGVIVEHFGYMNLFIFGFCAAIPSMLLLFFVPLHEDETKCLPNRDTSHS